MSVRLSTGRSWVQSPLAAMNLFCGFSSKVERRFEEPTGLVRFQRSTFFSTRVGSSAAEPRSAKAEARVQFPAGAFSYPPLPVFRERAGVRALSLLNAVITQPAECRSSKPETRVRIPLTASNAAVAQRAEQSPRKRPIAGSIPARGYRKSGA
jgi:hypothetical protein